VFASLRAVQLPLSSIARLAKQIDILSPFTDVEAKISTTGDTVFELDGLRGIAVLLVLMSHTSAFGMRGQGSLGVFLFFFLSGFLLTLPFADHLAKIRAKDAVLRFFVNRTLRIVPAYWLTLVLLTLWAPATVSWLLWNASFINGWNHLWSVAEEVRFYLLFPVVVWLASYTKNRLSQIGIVAALTWFAYQLAHRHTIDQMTVDNKSVNFYFWMFLGGVLACLFSRLPSIKIITQKPLVRSLLIAGSTVVLLCLFVSSNSSIETIWRPIFPSIEPGYRLNGWQRPGSWFFMFFLLLVAVTLVQDSFVNRFLRSKILRHVGLLSFSLYIIHMNVLQTLARRGLANEKLFVAVFVFSWIYAYGSYVLVERPFMRLKKSPRLRYNKHLVSPTPSTSKVDHDRG